MKKCIISKQFHKTNETLEPTDPQRGIKPKKISTDSNNA